MPPSPLLWVAATVKGVLCRCAQTTLTSASRTTGPWCRRSRSRPSSTLFMSSHASASTGSVCCQQACCECCCCRCYTWFTDAPPSLLNLASGDERANLNVHILNDCMEQNISSISTTLRTSLISGYGFIPLLF
jgi:hypothetical protein